MTYALYARQSVEKSDSISIAMQLDFCKKCLPSDAEYRTYTDCGFSGTHTNRPAFQQLNSDLLKGDVQAVVVYKLDRISRSLSDFAHLSQRLRQLGVQLISAVEQIDTRLPAGNLLQNLLVMFAELEQQTIASRIRDNYYARVRKQMPLGGSVPFGYTQSEHCIPVSDAAAVVQRMFHAAALGQSRDKIASDLNADAIPSPKGCQWSGSTVSRMLRNPFYVQGNAAVLNALVLDGWELLHTPEQYLVGNGYRRIGRKIAAADHVGIVSPELWLSVQERRRNVPPHCNRGSGQQSWLQGLVICGKCGQSCYVRDNGSGAPYRYFVCRGKRLGICDGLHAVRVGVVESVVERVLLQTGQRIIGIYDEKMAYTASELVTVEQEIADKFRKLRSESEHTAMILPEVQRLLQKKESIIRNREVLSTNFENMWKTASLAQKKVLAGCMTEAVLVEQDAVRICLKA